MEAIRPATSEDFPRQGTLLGKELLVRFVDDKSNTKIKARCIRNDEEAPWHTFHLLEDGRCVTHGEVTHDYRDVVQQQVVPV